MNLSSLGLTIIWVSLPLVEEIDVWNVIYKEPRGKSIALIISGLAPIEHRNLTKTIYRAQATGVDFPLYIDQNAAALRMMGIAPAETPIVFLVDRFGTVFGVHHPSYVTREKSKMFSKLALESLNQ